MENYLCPLKSTGPRVLSSHSTSWATDTFLTILCAVGLFLLLLPYLVQCKPPLPPPNKGMVTKEIQARSHMENPSLRFPASRSCLKELHSSEPDFASPSLLCLSSYQGLLSGPRAPEQMGLSWRVPAGRELCPWLKLDPPVPCSLLGEPPDKGRRHQRRGGEPSEPAAGAAPGASPSTATAPPTQPPRHLAPTASARPPEHPSDLEAEGPSDWMTEDWTTDDSSDRKTTPESFSACSVPTVTGHDGSSCPVSARSWWWAAAKAFLPWKHCESQQEHTCHHPSKASFWGGRIDGSIEPGSPSLLNPDVQKPLERAIAKRVESKIWKEKEKDRSFKKHVSPDYHLNSSRMLKSLSHEQATTGSKPEQLSSPQQLIYPKALGEHLLQKPNQLFWGCPSLHSESLGATAWVWESSPVQSPVLFNRISNACPVEVSSQCIPLQSSSPIPPLPPSTAQIRAYRIPCPSAQNETQTFISTEVQHLESPLLQKQLKRWGALPSVASQSQPSSGHPGLAHKSDSILSGNIPSRTELQKQLEQHIRKRITQHKWSLPSRIRESLELTQPWGRLPGTDQATDQHGPSWPSVLLGESSKDVKKMECRHQEGCCTRAPGKDLGKGLGQVPKYDISQGSEKSPVKVLQAGSEKELKSDSTSYSGSNTGNYILRNLDKKQLENPLNIHLGRELEHITKGWIPVSVRCSWLTASHTLPKSDTHIKKRNWKSGILGVNTAHEFSFLTPGTGQALEAHTKRFCVRHKWDLSVQAGKPMNLNLSETQSSPLSQYEFPSSATHESWASSGAEATKFWGENPQAGWGEKTTAKKSGPTLESLLPAPSPVGEQIQGALRQTPLDNDPRPSEPAQSRQEGRQPFQPLTPSIMVRASASRTVLGAQSSRDQETREAVVAKGSSAPQLQGRDILRTSVLAKSQNIDVDLTSKSPSPPGMPVQDPRKTHLKAQVLNEEELKMELETANQSQGCPTDTLL
uniref:SPATA31 domain-containing protein n=1 Tax=Loxodonta africana TaxID=9785 RepID=G3UH50_LOXAF